MYQQPSATGLASNPDPILMIAGAPPFTVGRVAQPELPPSRQRGVRRYTRRVAVSVPLEQRSDVPESRYGSSAPRIPVVASTIGVAPAHVPLPPMTMSSSASTLAMSAIPRSSGRFAPGRHQRKVCVPVASAAWRTFSCHMSLPPALSHEAARGVPQSENLGAIHGWIGTWGAAACRSRIFACERSSELKGVAGI